MPCAVPPLVFVLGPTAVGKSSLVLEHLSDACEIINGDSQQVYRRLDIGSAKPTAEQQARLPHHLIDIGDPAEQYSVGRFVREAEALIPQIIERGKIPIVLGGSGFYIRNLIYGLPEAPVASALHRDSLMRELTERGARSMHHELSRVDETSAARITPSDRYRIVRALEVYRTTGRPLSSFGVGEVPRGDYSLLIIGLQRPREELYERIERRVDSMFANRLVDEVLHILELGYTPDSPGLRGIGYRELLSGQSQSDAIETIKRNSRRYAKRQMTFFRRLPAVKWYTPDQAGEIRDVIIAHAGKITASETIWV